MKRSTKSFVKVLAEIAIILAILAMQADTAQAAQARDVPLPADVTNVICTIALGFGALLGVSKLVAALINLFKVFGLVKDGTANKWAAGLNLSAFVALVLLGVFRADLTMEILDGYAGQIAMVLLFILGFIAQITGSKATHEDLSSAGVPLIGKSFTKDAQAAATAMR